MYHSAPMHENLKTRLTPSEAYPTQICTPCPLKNLLLEYLCVTHLPLGCCHLRLYWKRLMLQCRGFSPQWRGLALWWSRLGLQWRGELGLCMVEGTWSQFLVEGGQSVVKGAWFLVEGAQSPTQFPWDRCNAPPALP